MNYLKTITHHYRFCDEGVFRFMLAINFEYILLENCYISINNVDDSISPII